MMSNFIFRFSLWSSTRENINLKFLSDSDNNSAKEQDKADVKDCCKNDRECASHAFLWFRFNSYSFIVVVLILSRLQNSCQPSRLFILTSHLQFSVAQIPKDTKMIKS